MPSPSPWGNYMYIPEVHLFYNVQNCTPMPEFSERLEFILEQRIYVSFCLWLHISQIFSFFSTLWLQSYSWLNFSLTIYNTLIFLTIIPTNIFHHKYPQIPSLPYLLPASGSDFSLLSLPYLFSLFLNFFLFRYCDLHYCSWRDILHIMISQSDTQLLFRVISFNDHCHSTPFSALIVLLHYLWQAYYYRLVLLDLLSIVFSYYYHNIVYKKNYKNNCFRKLERTWKIGNIYPIMGW